MVDEEIPILRAICRILSSSVFCFAKSTFSAGEGFSDNQWPPLQLCTLHSALCILHSALYINSALCTLHSALFIMYISAKELKRAFNRILGIIPRLCIVAVIEFLAEPTDVALKLFHIRFYHVCTNLGKFLLLFL